MEGIYQFTLFSQYMLIIVTVCMNLYILSRSDNVFAKVNGVMYLGAIASELNIYCIMSEIVVAEVRRKRPRDWNLHRLPCRVLICRFPYTRAPGTKLRRGASLMIFGSL